MLILKIQIKHKVKNFKCAFLDAWKTEQAHL